MSMDLTFLSQSYTKQILYQLKKSEYQKAQNKTDFGSVLSSKDTSKTTETPETKAYTELENYYKKQLMTNSFRSDLFGEQTVLTDRGTDWLSAFAYMGGHFL